MKNAKGNILWGSLFILAGIVFIGKVYGIWNFCFKLFDGWWTFLIIAPCCISLFCRGSKKANIIGLAIGLVLLLDQTNIIRGVSVFDLFIPISLIGIGISFFIRKSHNFMHTEKSDIPDSMSEQKFKGEYKIKNKVVASVILVVAIMLLLMGNLLENIHFSIGNIHVRADRSQPRVTSNQNFIEVYEEYDNVEQVELNLNRGDLKIVSGDKFSFQGNHVNEFDYSCTVNNNILVVNEKSTTNIFDGNASYILTVPSTTSLLKITVNSSRGTVKFNDIGANDVTFNVEKGSLEGSKLIAINLDVDAGMGSVNLHNILSQNIYISSGMGSVNMDCKLNKDNGDLKVDSPMGSVNLRLDNNPADFYFDLANRSSSININGVKATNYKYYNNDIGANNYGLKIGSGVGSVEVCFNN